MAGPSGGDLIMGQFEIGQSGNPAGRPKGSKLELDRDGVIRWQSLLGGGGES